MKQFNEDFKTKLYQTISEIENNSMVEVVTIIRQQSDHYKDIGMTVAAIFTAVLFTALMFIPIDIDAYLIYIITLIFFVFAYFTTMSIPGFLRIFIPKKRIAKSVEVLARAIFQKGGMRFTKEHIGVLFFVSFFEKKAIIIADRGVEMSVPQEEYKNMELQFSSIFNSSDVADNLLKFLSGTKDKFNKYIPPIEDDINELPDSLEVDL